MAPLPIEGSVALVTGAGRGLGAAFARALLERGAARVYASARDVSAIATPGVVPLRLDVTKPDDVAAIVQTCGDLTLLVNNAGVLESGLLGDLDAVDAARRQIETNALGPLALSAALAPTLGANGGGAIVNVLSVLSWVSLPGTGGYSMSKAAAWALTNALRVELVSQGTSVVGVHSGFIDTDMAAGVEGPKSTPEEVAALALDAVEAGRPEVLVDDVSRMVRARLADGLDALYPQPGASDG